MGASKGGTKVGEGPAPWRVRIGARGAANLPGFLEGLERLDGSSRPGEILERCRAIATTCEASREAGPATTRVAVDGDWSPSLVDTGEAAMRSLARAVARGEAIPVSLHRRGREIAPEQPGQVLRLGPIALRAPSRFEAADAATRGLAMARWMRRSYRNLMREDQVVLTLVPGDAPWRFATVAFEVLDEAGAGGGGFEGEGWARLLVVERLAFRHGAGEHAHATRERRTVRLADGGLTGGGDATGEGGAGMALAELADLPGLAARLCAEEAGWGIGEEPPDARGGVWLGDQVRLPSARDHVAALRRGFAHDLAEALGRQPVPTTLPNPGAARGFGRVVGGRGPMPVGGVLRMILGTTFGRGEDAARLRGRHFAAFPDDARRLGGEDWARWTNHAAALSAIDAGRPLVEVTRANLEGKRLRRLLDDRRCGSRAYRRAIHLASGCGTGPGLMMALVNALHAHAPATLPNVDRRGLEGFRRTMLAHPDGWALDAARAARWAAVGAAWSWRGTRAAWEASMGPWIRCRDVARGIASMLEEVLAFEGGEGDLPSRRLDDRMEGSPLWLAWRAAVARIAADLAYGEAASDLWHDRAPRFARTREASRARVLARGGEDAWPHVLDAQVRVGGVVVTPLRDREALLAEGEAVGHCVGSYAEAAAVGASMIVSLRGEGTMSTAEVRAMDRGGAPTPVVVQHEGPGQGPPDPCHVAALATALRGARPDWDAILAAGRAYARAGGTGSVYDELAAMRRSPEAFEAHRDLLHAELRRYMGRSDARLDRAAWAARVLADPTLDPKTHPGLWTEAREG